MPFIIFTVILIIISGCNSDEMVQKKNILMIIVDDMRPEIASWGSDVAITPNIDELVKNGISFRRAYAQYANCSPSRMSFLTGLSPNKLGHKGRYNDKAQFKSHITLPGYLKDNGYKTCSFGKVYHDINDDSSSWSFRHDIKREGDDLKWESYGLPSNQLLDGDLRPAIEKEELPLSNYNDYKITLAMENHLEKNKDNLFFYAIGFRKPHLPFAAPKKFWDMYDINEISLSKNNSAPLGGDTIVYQWSELASYRDFSKDYAGYNYRNKIVNANKSKVLIHGYMASISFIDHLIGRLYRKLKALDLDKNTIIVFMSDHGYHLGDQKIWGKHSSYEKSTHTPLIIVDPNIKEGGECMSFVELLDIYPTLIELIGLEKNSNLDGESLVTLIKDPQSIIGNASFSQYQSFQQERPFSDYMAYAIYTEDFNYIEWQDLKKSRNIVQKELYQMDENLRIEKVNLSNHEENFDLQDKLSSLLKENFGY